MNYFNNKTDAAQFADDLLTAFPNVLPSITIISPEKFVVLSATSTIDFLSEDLDEGTVATFFSQTQVNT